MMKYAPQDLLAYISMFYPGHRLLVTPYGYPLTFLDIANGETASQQINITANADFVFLGLHHFFPEDDATVSSKLEADISVLLTDSGSNERFTDSAVALPNYSSNDAKQLSLAYPRFVSGRSSLQVQVNNDSVAQTIVALRLFVEGVNVRAYSQTGGQIDPGNFLKNLG
jgi:hypothetical protein